jgi:oxygen-independent coproporphyrinogen-3 oxidase
MSNAFCEKGLLGDRKIYKKPISVYVHIPFCEKRCGYCDFASSTCIDKMDLYLNKLCEEISAFDFSNYETKTIFIGGGTPSLLSPAQIKRLFDALPNCNGEVTIECNPNSLTVKKCVAYKSAGINRLSVGVQSFDDRTLKSLGRLHDAQSAVDAVKLAGRYFDNVSIDLLKDMGNGLVTGKIPAEVLDIIKHVSVYSLMKDDLPATETDEQVYLPKTFHRYEVSNFSKVGFECSHNLVYWRGEDYIGFGAAAHSLVSNTRFNNTNDILNYHRENEHERTPDEVRKEKIMLGLRTCDGVEFSLVAGKNVYRLIDGGFIKIKCGHVTVTDKGFNVLNQVTINLT